jgi:hypothetical protein
MNKELFVALSDHIEKSVPELKWIDWDEGQLTIAGERPPVAFPCCLIGIEYANCRDLDERTQLVTANVTLRLGFTPSGETSAAAPRLVRDRALHHFDVIERLQLKLQGCELGGIVSAISRARATRTVRKDKVAVYTVVYTTTFQEIFE